MVRYLLVCTLLAFTTTGCFVIDEIDSGMKFMEEHSALEPEPEETEETSDAVVRPGFDWQSSRTITPGSRGNSDVVSCNLRGQVQFMKRDDCINRGGKPK